MKIRLEKPAMSISNLSGGKNEKARRGWGWGGGGVALHEKLRLDLLGVFFCFIMHIQTSFLTIMMS